MKDVNERKATVIIKIKSSLVVNDCIAFSDITDSTPIVNPAKKIHDQIK